MQQQETSNKNIDIMRRDIEA